MQQEDSKENITPEESAVRSKFEDLESNNNDVTKPVEVKSNRNI